MKVHYHFGLLLELFIYTYIYTYIHMFFLFLLLVFFPHLPVEFRMQQALARLTSREPL